MIVYKDMPPVSESHLCSFDRIKIIQKRRVEAVNKEIDTPIFLIAFLLAGAPIRWAFETEEERDYVWRKVKEFIGKKMKRIDEYVRQ